MKLYLWATHVREFMSTLLFQLEAGGVDFEVPEPGSVSWEVGNGWAGRMRDWHKWLQKQEGLVGFIDPWDHLFFGDKDELEEKAKRLVCPWTEVLWGAERICWPPLIGDDWESKDNRIFFPSFVTPYQFPNGGGIIGDAEVLRRYFDPAIIHGFGERNYDHSKTKHPRGNQEWMDQVYFQELYLQGLGAIDAKCEIFQTLIRREEGDFRVVNGRVQNTLTGSSPMFFHANGKTDFPKEVMEVLLNG